MRVKEDGAQTLIDLPLLQAERLGNATFRGALDRGDFDPFPDGSQATGNEHRRGALARNSGVTEAQLSGAALTGFDGALPDHIRDALHSGLHDDDDGMKAFLALFDRRLMQLELRARKAAVLVATQDKAGRGAASILDRLVRMVNHDGSDPRYAQLLLPLLSRTRTLEGLRDIVGWWTGHEVSVTARFDTMQPIDPDCRTRLSSRPQDTGVLGRGAILGRMGQTPEGRISISIACEDRKQLDALSNEQNALSELRDLITQYLRDPVPVTIYADVKRRYLSPPRLSAAPGRAGRLGIYNLFQPQRQPEVRSAIKLTGRFHKGLTHWPA